MGRGSHRGDQQTRSMGAFARVPAISTRAILLSECAQNVDFSAFKSVGNTGRSQVQAGAEWFEFSEGEDVREPVLDSGICLRQKNKFNAVPFWLYTSV